MKPTKTLGEYYWDIANATRMGRYLTKIEQEFIDEELRNPPMFCLDVGAGSGRFSIPLYNKKGFDVIALECDLLPLKKLKEKEGEIPLIQSGAHQLPFRSGVFDCIIAIETIDYLNPDVFLASCRRVLKHGGLLFLTSSNKKSYKGINRPLIKKLTGKPLYKIFYRFSYKELIEKLAGSGFSVETSYGFNWLPVERDSNSRLIAFYSFLERIFRLKHLPSISPYVFIAARKIWSV